MPIFLFQHSVDIGKERKYCRDSLSHFAVKDNVIKYLQPCIVLACSYYLWDIFHAIKKTHGHESENTKIKEWGKCE